MIFGEDGGLFLLFNSIKGEDENYNKFKQQAIEDLLGRHYLKDKLKEKKIIIGKGGFGTVKLCLSLLETKSKPGDVICIKKSKTL